MRLATRMEQTFSLPLSDLLKKTELVKTKSFPIVPKERITAMFTRKRTLRDALLEFGTGKVSALDLYTVFLPQEILAKDLIILKKEDPGFKPGWLTDVVRTYIRTYIRLFNKTKYVLYLDIFMLLFPLCILRLGWLITKAKAFFSVAFGTSSFFTPVISFPFRVFFHSLGKNHKRIC